MVSASLKTKKQTLQHQVVDFMARANKDLMYVMQMKAVHCTSKKKLKPDVLESIATSERAVDEILYGNNEPHAENILALVANCEPKNMPKLRRMIKAYDQHMRHFKDLVATHCKPGVETNAFLTPEVQMENVLQTESAESIKWVKWAFSSLATLEVFCLKVSRPGPKLRLYFQEHLLACFLLFLLIVTKFQSFKMFLEDAVYFKFRETAIGTSALWTPTIHESTGAGRLLAEAIREMKVPPRNMQVVRSKLRNQPWLKTALGDRTEGGMSRIVLALHQGRLMH